MKRTLLFIASFFLLLISLALTKIDERKGKDGYRGKVKSCIYFSYDITNSGDTVLQQFYIITHIRLDGQLTARIICDTVNHKILGGHTTFYDDMGRVIYTKNISGQISGRTKYRHDKSHRLIETRLHDDSTGVSETIYNRRGLPDTIYQHLKSGLRYIETIYKYDSRHNLVKETSFDAEGKITNRVISNYNGRNQLIAQSTYATNGWPDVHKRFKWDRAGNLIRETWYDGKNIMTGQSTYSYDKNGDIIMQKDTLEAAMRVGSKGSNSPAPKQNDVLLQTYKYADYDTHGNWITQNGYVDGVFVSITKRKFEYYK